MGDGIFIIVQSDQVVAILVEVFFKWLILL